MFSCLLITSINDSLNTAVIFLRSVTSAFSWSLTSLVPLYAFLIEYSVTPWGSWEGFSNADHFSPIEKKGVYGLNVHLKSTVYKMATTDTFIFKTKKVHKLRIFYWIIFQSPLWNFVEIGTLTIRNTPHCLDSSPLNEETIRNHYKQYRTQ